MLPRHPRDSDAGTCCRRLDNVHHKLLKRIQIMDIGERVVALGRQLLFGMRSGDYGKIAAKRCFDFSVKMVALLVRLTKPR